jgi:hypothetical protein
MSQPLTAPSPKTVILRLIFIRRNAESQPMRARITLRRSQSSYNALTVTCGHFDVIGGTPRCAAGASGKRTHTRRVCWLSRL